MIKLTQKNRIVGEEEQDSLVLSLTVTDALGELEASLIGGYTVREFRPARIVLEKLSGDELNPDIHHEVYEGSEAHMKRLARKVRAMGAIRRFATKA